MKSRIVAILLFILCLGAIILAFSVFFSDIKFYLKNTNEMLLGFSLFVLIPTIIMLYVYWTNFGKHAPEVILNERPEIKKHELEKDLKISWRKLIANVLIVGFYELSAYAICNYNPNYHEPVVLPKDLFEPLPSTTKFNYELFGTLNMILLAIIMLYIAILLLRKKK